MVTVAVARGKGLSGDLTLTFVDVEDADPGRHRIERLRPPDAIAIERTGIECDDIPFGDIVAFSPFQGTTEEELSRVGCGSPSLIADRQALCTAACSLRNNVAGAGSLLPARGRVRIAPAHEPARSDVSAPTMVIGSGRTFQH